MKKWKDCRNEQTKPTQALPMKMKYLNGHKESYTLTTARKSMKKKMMYVYTNCKLKFFIYIFSLGFELYLLESHWYVVACKQVGDAKVTLCH